MLRRSDQCVGPLGSSCYGSGDICAWDSVLKSLRAVGCLTFHPQLWRPVVSLLVFLRLCRTMVPQVNVLFRSAHVQRRAGCARKKPTRELFRLDGGGAIRWARLPWPRDNPFGRERRLKSSSLFPRGIKLDSVAGPRISLQGAVSASW